MRDEITAASKGDVDRIQALLGTLFEISSVKTSPAALAKSLDRADMDTIRRGYTVAQKADGCRVFVLLTKQTGFIFMRNWLCQRVAFTSSDMCLFDVELVGGTHVFVFDTLIMHGRSVVHKDYLYRVEL